MKIKKSYLLVIPAIICINFFLPRLMPGDPFLYLSVEDGNVATVFSPQQIAQYKMYYGLDKPIIIQFITYLVKLLKGDFGVSIYYNTSVREMIMTRIPWTIAVVVVSLLISGFIGTVLGTFSAWHRDNVFDRITYSIMLFISEIPSFMVGIFLLFVFAAGLKWFPLSGGSTAFAEYGTIWNQIGDILIHITLPVLTLVITRVGSFYLLARNSMITVFTKDYIRTAKGKGLKKHSILFRHALRNSFPPIIMQIFMSLGVMLGQAVLVESVFAYPGIGSLMREAVFNRDYALMQGIFLIMSMNILIMNFLADFIFGKLDPRAV
ncbi:MAG: ABC transporter permease [Lachnospiraceae bacterium]|nr:ABC transporter permease [Lachnospiraceae bacterium]